jgi:hypothetical protein
MKTNLIKIYKQIIKNLLILFNFKKRISFITSRPLLQFLTKFNQLNNKIIKIILNYILKTNHKNIL